MSKGERISSSYEDGKYFMTFKNFMGSECTIKFVFFADRLWLLYEASNISRKQFNEAISIVNQLNIAYKTTGFQSQLRSAFILLTTYQKALFCVSVICSLLILIWV